MIITHTFSEVVAIFSPVMKSIETFLLGLVDLDLAFFCDTPNKFLKLSKVWKSASHLTNAIISFPFDSKLIEDKVLDVISNSYCKHLEVRSTISSNENLLLDFLERLKRTRVRAVYLYIDYESIINKELIKKIDEIPRVWSIVVHNAKDSFQVDFGGVIFIDEQITDSCCGIVKREYFVNNVTAFTESQHFNSCLNRKVYISGNGGVRSCPSFSADLMNVIDIDSDNIEFSDKIVRRWEIRKDDIDVCKECEYRYMCTDCRAFVVDPKSETSKPLKCGYDPYSGVWEDWMQQERIDELMSYYRI